MSEENQRPSIGTKAVNLAKFTWQLMNYIRENEGESLVVTDEVYKERVSICKGCEKYDEIENECLECGCYIPAKAKVVLDSCPLNKWTADEETWNERFAGIRERLQEKVDKEKESQ